MSSVAEPCEAVIISGPRRGEIIRLDEGARVEEITGEEIQQLNAALDELLAALDRLSTEVRATNAAIRPVPETG